MVSRPEKALPVILGTVSLLDLVVKKRSPTMAAAFGCPGTPR
jgi:hypothetical protein